MSNQTNQNNQNNKQLALFDLDHTLLNIDSDYTWGEYIVNKGLVDEGEYREANQAFYEQYIAGMLDATEYNEFVANFLTTQTMEQLEVLAHDFIKSEILAQIRPKALLTIKHHKQQGHEVIIISATNDFVVNAVAKCFDIAEENVLATPLEIMNNRYTGKLSDKPNFKEGKIYHLEKWLQNKRDNGVIFSKSYGYSDSKNDIPLLEWADSAIAVTPDEILLQYASDKSWTVEDWSI